MIRGTSPPSPNPLAAAEGDADYFATEAYYLALANRMLDALRAGGSVVLITGDPPATSQLLSQALRKSTQLRHAVIDVPCRADLTSEELFRARSGVATLPASGGSITGSETSERDPPLFVFTDVDQLSDRQIREIFEATQHGGQKGPPALLLARSGFLTRLEEPSLQFLKERLAGQFGFHEAGRDEGIEFLRRQLAAVHARAYRNARWLSESRGIPVGLFLGLAASGVLLTVVIGAFLWLQYYHSLEDPSARLAADISSAPKVAAPRLTSDAPKTRTSAEDRASPRMASRAASPDPGRPAQSPEMILPEGAPPPARVAAEQPAPPLPAGPTATQSAWLPEPTPPVASPGLGVQLAVPKAASPAASLAPAHSSPSQGLSLTETAALVTRGDGFLSNGDIASARLFYERAADAGNGAAALRLGATFDPGFLGRAGIRGIPGEPTQAAFWYRRSSELGEAAAADRLKDLDQRPTGELNSTPR